MFGMGTRHTQPVALAATSFSVPGVAASHIHAFNVIKSLMPTGVACVSPIALFAAAAGSKSCGRHHCSAVDQQEEGCAGGLQNRR
jgi:hypothetical protein